jgi:DNA-binding NarL/FixJ family response regulator
MPQSATNSNGEKFAVIEALARLKQEYPNTAIIILSQYATSTFINAAIENDVRSFLLKNDDLSLNLLDAIEAVVKGGTLFSREINTILFRQNQKGAEPKLLTDRQIEIVLTRSRWPKKSSAQLAIELGIAESTLKTHLNRIFKALDVSSATECFIKSMQLGIIPFHLNDMGQVVFDWPELD